MTGWAAAAAATALLGATALGPVTYGQAVAIGQDSGADALTWLEASQSTLFGGGSGRIGVSVRDLDDADAKAGKTPSNGVKIEEVESDSPAQKAGLKAGDVVVEFDGERVRSTRQFMRLVQETPAGRQVSVAVMRDGQRVTMNVQPRDDASFRFKYLEGMRPFEGKEWTALPKIAQSFKFDRDLAPDVKRIVIGPGRLGIGIQDLSTQLAEYFGTKDGILVTSVTDNSNASRAGVKAGDVITSFNGQATTNAQDLRERAQRLSAGDEFTLGVLRDKKPLTLKGKIEQPAKPRPVTRMIL